MQEYLDKLSAAYYSGFPVVSDKEFDYLAQLHNYDVVGARQGEQKHYKQLYSLKKSFVGEKCPGFSTSWTSLISSPKLDGAAISLLYIVGKLVKATTRGDGTVGQDITSLALASTCIPSQIARIECTFVTGELVALKTTPNARNYAAGACGLKDAREFASRDLYFIAYGVNGLKQDSYSMCMQSLREDYAFETVLDCDWTQFPQDGKVFRVDSQAEYEELGYTSTHPRGAFALKDKDDFEVGETTLLDVVWQVGQSGQVTPVAIFEPVLINDASVSRASLANAGILEALELSIGDKILVTRANGVIPKVIGKC